MDIETDELSDDDHELVARLQDVFLVEFGGFGPIAGMLELGPFENIQDAQGDYVRVLVRILRVLIKLCGNRDSAMSWLIRNAPYRDVSGNDPYFCLEQGGFWAMAVMFEWLQIIDRYRPAEVMKNLFEPCGPRLMTSD